MPIATDDNVKVLPVVTDCDAVREPVASRREFTVSTIA
jgi:hypothetical protein